MPLSNNITRIAVYAIPVIDFRITYCNIFPYLLGISTLQSNKSDNFQLIGIKLTKIALPFDVLKVDPESNFHVLLVAFEYKDINSLREYLKASTLIGILGTNNCISIESYQTKWKNFATSYNNSLPSDKSCEHKKPEYEFKAEYFSLNDIMFHVKQSYVSEGLYGPSTNIFFTCPTFLPKQNKKPEFDGNFEESVLIIDEFMKPYKGESLLCSFMTEIYNHGIDVIGLRMYYITGDIKDKLPKYINLTTKCYIAICFRNRKACKLLRHVCRAFMGKYLGQKEIKIMIPQNKVEVFQWVSFWFGGRNNESSLQLENSLYPNSSEFVSIYISPIIPRKLLHLALSTLNSFGCYILQMKIINYSKDISNINFSSSKRIKNNRMGLTCKYGAAILVLLENISEKTERMKSLLFLEYSRFSNIDYDDIVIRNENALSDVFQYSLYPIPKIAHPIHMFDLDSLDDSNKYSMILLFHRYANNQDLKQFLNVYTAFCNLKTDSFELLNIIKFTYKSKGNISPYVIKLLTLLKNSELVESLEYFMLALRKRNAKSSLINVLESLGLDVKLLLKCKNMHIVTDKSTIDEVISQSFSSAKYYLYNDEHYQLPIETLCDTPYCTSKELLNIYLAPQYNEVVLKCKEIEEIQRSTLHPV